MRVRQWFVFVFMFSVATCAVYQWCLPVLGGALFLLPPPPLVEWGMAAQDGRANGKGWGRGRVCTYNMTPKSEDILYE